MSEVVVLETSEGTIEIELNRRAAPASVENFVQYVKSGFYDGLVFHRVIKNFMIQGGGFTPDASEKKTRPPIAFEADNGLKNDAGTIAMARTNDPGSATSQFFINLKNNDFLNHSASNDGYAVFGKVTSGLDVVKKIGEVKTATKGFFEDWPAKDVVIKNASYKA